MDFGCSSNTIILREMKVFVLSYSVIQTFRKFVLNNGKLKNRSLVLEYQDDVKFVNLERKKT